jgi:predicted esterase
MMLTRAFTRSKRFLAGCHSVLPGGFVEAARGFLAAFGLQLAAGTLVATGALVTVGAMAEVAMAQPTSAALEMAFIKSGDNREQLERALLEIAAEQREGLVFLLENMSTDDLKQLTSAFLLEHVSLAYRAREEAAWGEQVPDDIFLNHVLPYANVNERRDDVRRELRERFWPKVMDSSRISVAAARLNQLVFEELNVRYSTKRRRADQGPRESMDTGLASCTGLSILLIDACRACGVPARFVGTPLWTDGSGNHSWVEIWDNGWHFTGAAEPTGERLNEAWFVDRAGSSQPGTKHGIFAVSFRRTTQRFPLPWLNGTHEIWAEEVTERYARQRKVAPGMLSLQFRALQAGSRDRCQANLIIRDDEGAIVYRGQTKDERFDANDHLTVQLAAGAYEVELRTAEGVIKHAVTANEDGQLVSLQGPRTPGGDNPASVPDAVPGVQADGPDLSDDVVGDQREVVTNTQRAAGEPLLSLEAYLQAHAEIAPEQLLAMCDEDFVNQPLTREQASRAVERLVEFYRRRVLTVRAEEHQAQRIELGGVVLKYDVKRFGVAPAEGHCLVISMHGGGGAPARVNDQQWENQKRLYQLEEGIYVAPRGPTDTWNLWHQEHIDPLFTRLIANMIAFEAVDPNRIYLTGYSAGGDGVYQLAPRMADQLAAAAMMAGHPNETQPDGLRNLPFTLHVGGKDAAYNRNDIARQWAEKLAELHRLDPAGYPHWAKIHEDKGHWMDRDDAEGIVWMLEHRRNIVPERVVWLQDDVVHDRFYWLAVDRQQAAGGQKIVAERTGQRITIEHADLESLQLLLNDALVDLDQPIDVESAGVLVWQGKAERTLRTIIETLVDRGDPTAVYTARLRLAASR